MRGNKRGQLAIFVIIAIVIVAVIIAIIAYPKVSNYIAPREFSPTSYLQDCISPEIEKTVNLLGSQGGYEKPEGYIEYNGVKVTILCYNSGYFETCMIQKPLLMSDFSDEMSRILNPRLETCMKNLEAEYNKRNYKVKTGKTNSAVSLSPGKISVSFLTPMTVSNEKETRTFDKFDIKIDSKIYDLLAVATTIVDYEATYGDSETTAFMQYYPDYTIEKRRIENNVKIYILTDIISGTKFTFASRSLAWKAGY